MHETRENLGFGDPPPRLLQRSFGSTVSPFTRQNHLIVREMRKYNFLPIRARRNIVFFVAIRNFQSPIPPPSFDTGRNRATRLVFLPWRGLCRWEWVLPHTADTRGRRSSQRVLARLGFSRLSRYYGFRRFGFSRIWLGPFFLLRFVGFLGSVWFGRCRDRGFRSRGSFHWSAKK